MFTVDFDHGGPEAQIVSVTGSLVTMNIDNPFISKCAEQKNEIALFAFAAFAYAASKSLVHDAASFEAIAKCLTEMLSQPPLSSGDHGVDDPRDPTVPPKTR
jgi:hypothetical protein